MSTKSLVFCFLLFFMVHFCDECYALKSGDKGVCEVSSYTTRKVYYTRQNPYRKCRGKPCVNRYSKIQRKKEQKTRQVCCSGWQYKPWLDACLPECSSGCFNGTCVAPFTCQCDPPLYLEPKRKNTCLPPTCDVPCVNAECTAPNECTCNNGYKRKDSTTCELECPKCVNAICTEPNKCTCLPGYIAVNDTACASSEDVCLGHDCICREGYGNVDGRCEPMCSKECVNGECTAPDVCTCFEGYERNATSPEVCWKPCLPQCGGECDVNGQCPDIACEPIRRNFT